MSIKVTVEEGEPVDLAEFTEGLLRHYAEELSRLIDRVTAGEFGDASAIPGQVKQLREVFQLVQEERARVERIRKQTAGFVGAGQLDFQSARDEIGRRLACLRDGGAG